MTIRLELPVPPTSNHYWSHFLIKGKPRIGLSSNGRKYRKAVRAACLAAGIRPMAGPVELTFVWHCGPYGGDLDNRRKALLDALKGMAYLDDGQVAIDHGARVHCVAGEQPRMVVQVRPAAEAWWMPEIDEATPLLAGAGR